ncbi:MAG: hypothetical protein ACREJ3_07105, partial [Polyangiaceae bacterium]
MQTLYITLSLPRSPRARTTLAEGSPKVDAGGDRTVDGQSSVPSYAQGRQGGARKAPTPRERITRMRALAGRGLSYWKGSVIVLFLTTAAGLAVARSVKHVYRAECTVVAKVQIRTDDREDSSTSPDQILRQAARLKDMLTTRGRLEAAIKKFGLYPEAVADKSILDAVEQMKPHVGFRSLEGAQYVISFDGDSPRAVQEVTAYLSGSLIDDYAANGLDDLRRDADFLSEQERVSRVGLETSTRALTVFLAAHPEFAMEARQAAPPYGPGVATGIPLMPKLPKEVIATRDADLAALYRERARLEEAGGALMGAHTGVPARVGTAGPIDEQLVEAEAAMESAAKWAAETQADLASKSNLTEDHPDMRAARMAASSAARRLHETRGALASLRQLRSRSVPLAPATIPPDLAEKLRQVDAQIAMRRAKLAGSHAAGSEDAAASKD